MLLFVAAISMAYSAETRNNSDIASSRMGAGKRFLDDWSGEISDFKVPRHGLAPSVRSTSQATSFTMAGSHRQFTAIEEDDANESRCSPLHSQYRLFLQTRFCSSKFCEHTFTHHVRPSVVSQLEVALNRQKCRAALADKTFEHI